VRPGETVEIEAPDLIGRLSGLDVAERFRGHRAAIRITTRRLW
jgi:hypothetical protein